MVKQSVKAGALFAIPGGEQFALAKVIYMSEYFRDVILIRLYAKPFKNIEAAQLPAEDAESMLYYTGLDSIRKGDWQYFGDQSVSDKERAMTKRIVGGDVWIEDTHVGPATEADLVSLKNMDTYGYRLITKAVSRLTQ